MEVVEVFEDKGFFKGSPVEGLSIVLTVNFYWLLIGDKTHPFSLQTIVEGVAGEFGNSRLSKEIPQSRIRRNGSRMGSDATRPVSRGINGVDIGDDQIGNFEEFQQSGEAHPISATYLQNGKIFFVQILRQYVNHARQKQFFRRPLNEYGSIGEEQVAMRKSQIFFEKGK